jgi:hypothetical protein
MISEVTKDIHNNYYFYTFKTPSLSAFMSDKGNCYHALEKCEGVLNLHLHLHLVSYILL